MNKQHILNEIRRTADANSGKALGRERFEKETGIKFKDWYGRYWARWGDALKEAGLEPNRLQSALPDAEVLPKLVALIRELGRYPTYGEIRMREYADKGFPSIVVPLVDAENTGDTDGKLAPEMPDGYVYLALMKVGREKRYKIGKADIVGRRTKQVGVNLPEDLELVHAISTDDAYGIEGYWHRRFAEQRRGGEWFDLSAADVKAFKRRKFM